MLRRINHLHGIGRTEPKYLYLRFDLYMLEADIGVMQHTVQGAQEMMMRATLPLYEGDSIVHYGAQVALPKAPAAAPAPAKASLWAAPGRAIAAVFLWLEKGTERARYRQLENYLAGSGDVFELERRMRHIERGYDTKFDPYS